MISDVSYKTLTIAKSLRIMFYKMDGFIIDYDGTKHSTLLGSKKYNYVFNRIKFFIRLKSNISYVVSHNYGKIIIDSDDNLFIE